MPKEELNAFRGVYLETAQRLKEQQRKGENQASPEVQQLIWASMPLLRQLSEDQKREVRRLVLVIGLEQVASQI